MKLLRIPLAPVYALAAIGTPAAYIHLTVGVFAGLEGIAGGNYVLGAALAALSILALFALWRMWSIGRRAWNQGAYAIADRGGFILDVRGLLSAWIAFPAFYWLAEALYRSPEIIVLATLLGPAMVMATLVFAWAIVRQHTGACSADKIDENTRFDTSSSPPKLDDLPGIACGVAVGLLGIYYFVPLPHSGWGPCDLSIFFPRLQSLWPTERPVIFDSCSKDILTIVIITSALSLVCIVTGAIATAVGRLKAPKRGLLSAAFVVAFFLTLFAAAAWVSPDGPFIAWLGTIALGSSLVAGAAMLGYLGGAMVTPMLRARTTAIAR